MVAGAARIGNLRQHARTGKPIAVAVHERRASTSKATLRATVAFTVPHTLALAAAADRVHNDTVELGPPQRLAEEDPWPNSHAPPAQRRP